MVEQWQKAAPALAEVRRQELRKLSDDEALAAAEALLDLLAYSAPVRQASGLVEQQRLFARSPA